MTHKGIILVLVLGIVILGGVYIAIPKKMDSAPTVTSTATTDEVPNKEASTTDSEPKKDTSSDQIVDYLVDTLSGEETDSAKATIDKAVPASTDTSITNPL